VAIVILSETLFGSLPYRPAAPPKQLLPSFVPLR
jgi:hypothetical protein